MISHRIFSIKEEGGERCQKISLISTAKFRLSERSIKSCLNIAERKELRKRNPDCVYKDTKKIVNNVFAR